MMTHGRAMALVHHANDNNSDDAMMTHGRAMALVHHANDNNNEDVTMTMIMILILLTIKTLARITERINPSEQKQQH